MLISVSRSCEVWPPPCAQGARVYGIRSLRTHSRTHTHMHATTHTRAQIGRGRQGGGGGQGQGSVPLLAKGGAAGRAAPAHRATCRHAQAVARVRRAVGGAARGALASGASARVADRRLVLLVASSRPPQLEVVLPGGAAGGGGGTVWQHLALVSVGVRGLVRDLHLWWWCCGAARAREPRAQAARASRSRRHARAACRKLKHSAAHAVRAWGCAWAARERAAASGRDAEGGGQRAQARAGWIRLHARRAGGLRGLEHCATRRKKFLTHNHKSPTSP